MKRLALTLIAGTLLLFSGTAQTTQLGGPISWHGKLPTNTNIQQVTMPAFDLAAIQAEDAINDQTKSKPWRFGYKYDTDISLENSGTWITLPNGNRIWQVEIIAPGARTINLALSNVHLPEGAKLHLYDYNQTHYIGAYTSRNNHPSQELGTELVYGDHIIVEYMEPKHVVGQGRFTISNVVHGYRSLNIIQNSLAKALNSSGSCNIDARCELDPYVGGISAWDDQIRSVAMIVVGTNGVCTGALINNTCDDGTPYFLTANHCLGAGGGTGNWLFRFNWDVPEGDPGMSCATTANTPNSFNNPSNYNQTTVNGATTLVSGTQADHALLLLDNLTVTDATNWGLFYAGWDYSDNESAVTAITGIHHPAGDIKKICRANDNGNNISHQNAGNPSAATWYLGTWSDGVTEPGSSGSPLFDQNGRIIGQLYGGAAACAGTSNNGQYDYYGRLGVSWGLGIGGYLNPASCSSTSQTNDGWDPNDAALPDNAGVLSVNQPTGSLCGSGTFTPEVVIRNFGTNALTSVTINYDVDGGTNNTFNWTGNLATNATATVTLPAMTTTNGNHTFNASTSDPNGTTDTEPANDASSSSFNVTLTGQQVTLSLETDCWGYETYWELVDATSSVVASGGNTSGIPPGGAQNAGAGDPGAYGNEVTITENWCLADGCYDFIIYDDYGDGLAGNGQGSCTTDGNFTITDGSGTTLASLQTVNFGNSDTSNFCVLPPCNSTFSSSTTQADCYGDNDGEITVTFTAGNASGATFDIGNGPQASGTFTGLAPGDYTVTIIDGDNCTSVVMVTLGGPSEITGTTNVTDETSGGDGAINLTPNGGAGNFTFSWTGPNGFTANTEDIDNLEDGTYSVTITDANGCSITLNGIDVAAASTSGIEDLEAGAFTLYPNPSNGLFYIQMSDATNGSVMVQVTDVTGRMVYDQIESATTFTVDLSNNAKGAYFLNISSNGTQFTKTIVKK